MGSFSGGGGGATGPAGPAGGLADPVISYNAIGTVSGGIPAEYATVDLTAQEAVIGATTLYAVPVGGVGLYRVSYSAKLTRVATTSSILGGANGFQIRYTDPDSVVVTTAQGSLELFPLSELNTTQAQINGIIYIFAKASTNIQYLMDYTSVGATTMQYNLHALLEKL